MDTWKCGPQTKQKNNTQKKKRNCSSTLKTFSHHKSLPSCLSYNFLMNVPIRKIVDRWIMKIIFAHEREHYSEVFRLSDTCCSVSRIQIRNFNNFVGKLAKNMKWKKENVVVAVLAKKMFLSNLIKNLQD